MVPATIKGTALRGLMLAIERVAGPEGAAAVRAALPPQVQETLARVLPSGDYPIEVAAEVHYAVRRTIGKGTFNLNYELGVEAARIDFRGVYRAVLWATTYESLFARVARSWHRYNSVGEVTWTLIEDGQARGHITGVAGWHLGMWLTVAGRVAGLLGLSGAKEPRVVVVRQNANGAEFHASWVP